VKGADIMPILERGFQQTRDKWTDEEQQRFAQAVRLYKNDWKKVSKAVGTRSV